MYVCTIDNVCTIVIYLTTLDCINQWSNHYEMRPVPYYHNIITIIIIVFNAHHQHLAETSGYPYSAVNNTVPYMDISPKFKNGAGIALYYKIVGRHSKKLVTIVYFMIKAQNLVYVLKKSL